MVLRVSKSISSQEDPADSCYYSVSLLLRNEQLLAVKILKGTG